MGLGTLITDDGLKYLRDLTAMEDLDLYGVKITDAGVTVGTVLYMSPEQCIGKKLDARSDIYSIGCVMYETLTGKPPS